jgi:hypothetical protein
MRHCKRIDDDFCQLHLEFSHPCIILAFFPRSCLIVLVVVEIFLVLCAEKVPEILAHCFVAFLRTYGEYVIVE